MKLKRILLAMLLVIVVIITVIYIRLLADNRAFETCTIQNLTELDTVNFKNYKKLSIRATTLYEPGILKTLIQGDNYREAWSTTVEVPVVFLDTLHGGMTIVKEGGGKQTQSLRLQSENGTLYTMRSVNKNPEKLIPEFAKTLGLQNIVVDGISAQHPYAAPVVSKMANAVEVLHTNPKTIFVPKQKTLGIYNEKYGNRLYLLEYENKGDVNWTTFENVTEIVDTDNLQELKSSLKDSLHINKSALVRARLFDLVIGDWDRHAKQWGWAVIENDSVYTAYPIPTDRDNAFFKIGGLIPNIISNENVVAEVRPFENDIDYMEGLIYDFDVYFLQNTDKEIFLKEAAYIQNNLTDDAIEDALRLWNDELYNLYGAEISEKLKARRDQLDEFAMRFKDVLDAKPLLTQPLKGSEGAITNPKLLQCFECADE